VAKYVVVFVIGDGGCVFVVFVVSGCSGKTSAVRLFVLCFFSFLPLLFLAVVVVD